MVNEIDNTNFTANDLLTPSISNTVAGAEPSGRFVPFLKDLFPNPDFLSGFTTIKPIFKVDDDIVLFYFDESVRAGTGDIVISSAANTQLIDVNDATQVKFGAPHYSSRNPNFQNSEEFGVVTINPSKDFLLGTEYTIQVADGVFLNSEGNSQPGFNSKSFTTIDSSPNLYSFNQLLFPVDGNIELHFDEAVAPVTGKITISNGTDIRTIAIDDTSQVNFTGDVITIDLTEDLLSDSTYVLQIESGAISDEDGHPSNKVFSSFYQTRPAIPQLLLVDSNPENDSADFKADEDIKLKFNKVIKAGTGHLILSNGLDTREIAIDDKSQVTFDNYSVVINPSNDLIPGTKYTATMASGVITDMTGTPYDGFTDGSFLTINPNPILLGEGELFDNVKNDERIRLFFDEEIFLGSGNIIISDGQDTRTINIKDTSQVTLIDSGRVLIIKPDTPLNSDATYSVQIPSNAITDAKGNTSLSDYYRISLNTIDSAPQFVGSYPIDGGNINFDQPIVLRFDEKIMAGDGNLVISNGLDSWSIAMTDRSQATFNGRSVIIDPIVDLVPGTTYTAIMVSGAIVDLDGNAYSGFSGATFTVNEIPLVGLVQTLHTSQGA